MIEEEAFVAEVTDGRVWLEKSRVSACSSCTQQSCSTAVVGGLFGTKLVRLQVDSDLPLQAGDRVLVGVSENALVRGSFWIYLLPLCGLFIGALLAKSLLGSDVSSAIGGLAGLALTFVLMKSIRLFDREADQPVILSKISPL
jgi:sigma-E factor negative regulatory protein RseC